VRWLSSRLHLDYMNSYPPFRTHWSLFPAVFDDRRLGSDICDELVGILTYGSMGEFVLQPYSCHRLTADITDMITSKSSTLPYDVDTMQQMTRLVYNAKGTLGHSP